MAPAEMLQDPETLVASPAVSVVIDALPEAIASVIRRVRFGAIRFADRNRLSKAEIANDLTTTNVETR